MALTAKQLEAVNRGEAVAVKVDNTECVVLRKDVYHTMRQPDYDDSDWTDEETERLASQMFDGMDKLVSGTAVGAPA